MLIYCVKLDHALYSINYSISMHTSMHFRVTVMFHSIILYTLVNTVFMLIERKLKK